MPAIYSGPAKVTLHSAAAKIATLQAEGADGAVNLNIEEKREQRWSALGGYAGSHQTDITAKVTLTPFDSWASLAVLYPFACVSVGGTPGGLAIGERAHDHQAAAADGLGATKLWTPTGTLWQVVRTAITKHPNMKLGVGMPLFDGIEITGLCDPAKAFGASGSLIAANAITESAASDTDATFPDGAFLNGFWQAKWGTLAPFGDEFLQADDGWELSCEAKYGIVTGAKRTWHMHFEGVQFAVKGKLIGPTASAQMAVLLAHTQGQLFGATTLAGGTNLVLTGPQSKTITLNNCVPVFENSGYVFAGSKLAAGEVAFVTATSFASPNAPDVVVAFS